MRAPWIGAVIQLVVFEFSVALIALGNIFEPFDVSTAVASRRLRGILKVIVNYQLIIISLLLI